MVYTTMPETGNSYLSIGVLEIGATFEAVETKRLALLPQLGKASELLL